MEPARREGELWRIRAQAGLSVVAIVAVDIFFHFFYILTIPSDLKFASRLPDSALGGCAPGPEQGRGRGRHFRRTDPLRPNGGGVTAGEAGAPGDSTYCRVGERGFSLRNAWDLEVGLPREARSGTRQRPPTSPGPGADSPSQLRSPRGQPLPPGRGGGACVGRGACVGAGPPRGRPGRKDLPPTTPELGREFP